MHQGGPLLFAAIVFVVVLGPALFAAAGLIAGRNAPDPKGDGAVPWRQSVTSALLFALAYNIIFFLQELFLVVPKALTPGLKPILYHNNHNWTGDNPLAALFQGTGAAAILLVGLVCAALAASRGRRGATLQTFILWMAFHGLFQALPQIPTGMLSPETDVGVAMDYLQLGFAAKMFWSLLALAAIPAAAIWLTGPMLELAGDPRLVATRRQRTAFIFRIATLPALAGVLLVVPFRLPGGIGPVLISPILVSVIGLVWIQAGAWNRHAPNAGRIVAADRIGRMPVVALLLLLAIFQVVLRPGIAFY